MVVLIGPPRRNTKQFQLGIKQHTDCSLLIICVQMNYQLLSATERDAIVARYLNDFLPPLGLTERATRSWIDGSHPPVRRLFEIQLLKGASMKANWGFSLDFVPHIAGGRIRWHRTDKTAMLDIVLDPKDLHRPSYIHGPERLAEGLRILLPEATVRAEESWRKCASFHGMLDLIREIRDKHINCFRYQNYTQLPLAYAFLLARTGDLGTAETELDKYALSHRLDDDEVAKLKKLAIDYARPNGSSLFPTAS